MIQELLYTSAPKGLKPGSRGFCTVLSTSGMPAPVATTLESLSGYRPVYPPGDPRVDQNPVVYSHLILSLAGKRSSVLSRVADYGLDYSQRTNKLAHHVVLDPQQRPAVGPAWLLQSPGFMRTEWNGELEVVPGKRAVPQGDTRIAVCQAWQQLTGDAGWAGVLAESILSDSPRQAFLVFEPGQDVLPLIAEAIALLPASRRWEVTFSTYFTKLPQGTSCLWRCVLAGSAEANESRRHVQALRLDFTKPLGRAEGGPLVEAARTGSLPTSQPAGDVESTAGAMPPPPPSPDDAPHNIQETQAGRPGSAPPPRLPLEARIAARQQSHPRQQSSWKIWAGVVMLLLAVGGVGTVMLLQGKQPGAMENSLALNEAKSTVTPNTTEEKRETEEKESPPRSPAVGEIGAGGSKKERAQAPGSNGPPAAAKPTPTGSGDAQRKPAMEAVAETDLPTNGNSPETTGMPTTDGGKEKNPAAPEAKSDKDAGAHGNPTPKPDGGTTEKATPEIEPDFPVILAHIINVEDPVSVPLCIEHGGEIWIPADIDNLEPNGVTVSLRQRKGDPFRESLRVTHQSNGKTLSATGNGNIPFSGNYDRLVYELRSEHRFPLFVFFRKKLSKQDDNTALSLIVPAAPPRTIKGKPNKNEPADIWELKVPFIQITVGDQSCLGRVKVHSHEGGFPSVQGKVHFFGAIKSEFNLSSDEETAFKGASASMHVELSSLSEDMKDLKITTRLSRANDGQAILGIKNSLANLVATRFTKESFENAVRGSGKSLSEGEQRVLGKIIPVKSVSDQYLIAVKSAIPNKEADDASGLSENFISHLKGLKDLLEQCDSFLDSLNSPKVSELVITQEATNGRETKFVPFVIYPENMTARRYAEIMKEAQEDIK